MFVHHFHRSCLYGHPPSLPSLSGALNLRGESAECTKDCKKVKVEKCSPVCAMKETETCELLCAEKKEEPLHCYCTL